MVFKNVIQGIVFIFLLTNSCFSQGKAISFKAEQLKNKRVQAAYDLKWPSLQSDLRKASIKPDNFDIYLRAFKHESELQVWMKNKDEKTYKLFRTYTICASSGSLGPKRKEGDGQVPEGFYKIDLFNPSSNYYLSMRISYPNMSDMILKEGANPGGAIMIHGNCVTIGCLPMTDDKIKELYILSLEARNRHRSIDISIFPIKFTAENTKMLETTYSKTTMAFWKTLLPAYTYFEKHHQLPTIKTNAKGIYTYEE